MQGACMLKDQTLKKTRTLLFPEMQKKTLCAPKYTPFKVPEGHHPRGTALREVLRGNLPLLANSDLPLPHGLQGD